MLVLEPQHHFCCWSDHRQQPSDLRLQLLLPAQADVDDCAFDWKINKTQTARRYITTINTATEVRKKKKTISAGA
jgi:hypothetical protein